MSVPEEFLQELNTEARDHYKMCARSGKFADSRLCVKQAIIQVAKAHRLQLAEHTTDGENEVWAYQYRTELVFGAYFPRGITMQYDPFTGLPLDFQEDVFFGERPTPYNPETVYPAGPSV